MVALHARRAACTHLPILELGLHRRARHLLEPLDLGRNLLWRLGLHLRDVVGLLLAAALARLGRAERRLAGLHDVPRHVLVVAELGAHRVVRLLDVRRARDAGLGIKVTDGGPAARAWVVVPPNLLLAQIHVPKAHVLVVSKRLGRGVPRRRLLPSSPSSLRGDPAHEHCAPGVDLGLDGLLERVDREASAKAGVAGFVNVPALAPAGGGDSDLHVGGRRRRVEEKGTHWQRGVDARPTARARMRVRRATMVSGCTVGPFRTRYGT
mmetsp:Transcript_88762/g.253688  ORF Transcript_88762/g.253688 Transcript_88762/m.253688 type:complete len:266 (+) Transcript_88762:1041-1838(+)